MTDTIQLPKLYSGLTHLNGNLLASVDLETTGKRPGYHEPIQIAIVPLNSDLRPLDGVRTFYHTMKPMRPLRAEKSATYVHNLDIDELVLHAPEPGKVADWLVEWFEELDLPFGKQLVPLAHNWAFECSFFKPWLGDTMDKIFHYHPRDAMLYALALNDKAAFAGESPPFSRVGLESLCDKFNVNNPNPHDALCDAIAEAEVYRSMLIMDLF